MYLPVILKCHIMWHLWHYVTFVHEWWEDTECRATNWQLFGFELQGCSLKASSVLGCSSCFMLSCLLSYESTCLLYQYLILCTLFFTHSSPCMNQSSTDFCSSVNLWLSDNILHVFELCNSLDICLVLMLWRVFAIFALRNDVAAVTWTWSSTSLNSMQDFSPGQTWSKVTTSSWVLLEYRSR